MSEKTIRIRTNLDERPYYLKFKLEQKFDFLDILSLRISQEEIYRKFCADYGVVIGRVTANEGFGIPNAKVSIFIPLDEIDSSNGLISGLYPYEHTTDKNDKGVRYNLLPKKRKNECHLPVGSFPNKREVLDNDVMLEIYKKYYKFTTTTNNAGDFMLFGIPVGTHTIHLDVDVSDIGFATRRPYDLTVNGSVSTLFDSPTKFKVSNDLDSLRHIIKGTTSVDVKPFWGENEDCDVGINRVDYNIPERIESSAIFMGSVIADEDKHSINRHCRARKKTGKLCELTTGAGNIEMIRKTEDGNVEYKLIKGGRVIDDDGTWVYQVPMNLKPMVTDEFGNLVESEDPRKGLFSEAEVRFRIKMDVTGGEGRIREKAEYLVPHNPTDDSEIDYNFDSNTSDRNFFKMKWNKIYTIRNFIPRFQANIGFGVDNRNWVGIKEVDRCDDKTNFPYSRMDTNVNPLFSIIMTLLSVLVIIVTMLNKFIIPIINILIWVINWIMNIVNNVILSIERWLCSFITGWQNTFCPLRCCGGTVLNWCISASFCPVSSTSQPIPSIKYLGCLSMKCEQSSTSGVNCGGNPQGAIFAPGCECCDCNDNCNDISCSGNDGGCTLNIYDTDQSTDTHPVFHTKYNNSSYPPGTIDASGFKYISCVGSGLADYFEMFTFDFYNDWINGTLYYFLFKYKRKAKRRTFCDVDYTCTHNSNLFCMENHIADTSVQPQPDLVDSFQDFFGVDLHTPMAEKAWETRVISTGLIKEFDNHMYYAPYSNGHKLYATDITCLGGTYKCDVDGFPYIIDRIPTTTYNRGPLFDTTEVECVNPSTGQLQTIVTESGIIGYGGGEDGLFMNVNPLGLFVNYCQSRHIRLQSELGRNIDEEDGWSGATQNVDVNNTIGMLDTGQWNNYIDNSGPQTCDGVLDQPIPLELLNGPESQDIFDEYVRYGIRGLNTPNAAINGIFDGVVAGKMYDPGFVSINGYSAHTIFRGFNGYNYGAGDAEYGFGNNTPSPDFQPDVKGLPYNNSYYFYFGLRPSKSAINKLNTRFLTDCDYFPQNDFILEGVTTDVTLVGGNNGTLTVEILGGDEPYEYEIIGPNGFNQWLNGVNNNLLSFTNLFSGTYIITVIDSTNGSARGVFMINEPPAMVANISSINPTSFGVCNGNITVNNISGGNPPGGNYNITLSSSTAVISNQYNQFPVEFSGLCGGNYQTIISDGNVSEFYHISLITPPPMNIIVQWTNISCHDVGDGQVNVSVNGGVTPYDIHLTSASNGYDSFGSSFSNLIEGNYILEVFDNNGGTPNTIMVNGNYLTPPINSVNINMVNPNQLGMVINNNGLGLRCNGNTNGSLYGSIYGGTPPYTINYGFGPDELLGNNTYIKNNLGASPYNFIVTDDNGCTTSINQTIYQPISLQLTIDEVNHVSCHGGDNASIKVSFGGGVPESNQQIYSNYHQHNVNAYKIQLYDDGGTLIDEKIIKYNSSGIPSTNTVTFDAGILIPAGDYIVKLYDYYSVTSNWGCLIDKTVTVTEPPTLICGGYPVDSTTITLYANGGTPSYQYRVNDSGWSSWSSNPTFTVSTADTDYQCQARDANIVCTSTIITIHTPTT